MAWAPAAADVHKSSVQCALLKILCARRHCQAVRLLRSAPLIVGHQCGQKKAVLSLQRLSIQVCQPPASRIRTGRSRNESIRLLDAFYESPPHIKTGFQARMWPALRCWPSNSAVSRTYALSDRISFDSQRELLAQTAKNRFQPWNRGKKLNCPRGSRARDRRDTRAGRNSS